MGNKRQFVWQLAKKSLLPLLFIAIIATLYAAYAVNLRPAFSKFAAGHAHRAFVVVFALSIAYLLHRLSNAAFNFYKINIAEKTQTKLDDDFIPLFKMTAGIVIWVITLIIALSALGVNINALVATLGVSSLAIALAAQDTIANIIAGFLIMIDRPFRPGDKIKLPSGEKVEVLQIGIRRSKFFQKDDSAIIIVSNQELSKSKIVNYTYAEEQSAHI